MTAIVEHYKTANREKYQSTNERLKFATHASKIASVESFRRTCRRLATSDERVLDIGGGSGIWIRVLEEEGIPLDAYALDLSPSMLRERRSDRGVCGDMEQLPFADASFDRVFFFASLHHVRNTRRALDEARRVTKPEGHVVLNEPTSLRLLVSGHGITVVDGAEFAFSTPYLLSTLEAAGWRVVYRRHRGMARRLWPGTGGLRIHRLAERIDDLLNAVPFIRRVGVLGSVVTIVARKV